MTRPIAVTAWSFVVLSLMGCASGDGRQLAGTLVPPPPPPTAPPTTVPAELPSLVVPSTAAAPTSPSSAPASIAPPSASISIDQLSSAENGIALVTGRGGVATDPVTVDGEPGDVVSFEVAGDGSFTARVFIADEGAHTVCVGGTCGRVFTPDPDVDGPEDVIAKIDEALTIARGIVPYDVWFPDWTVEIGGAMSGTGGTVDDERRTVTIFGNRGRSVDDFVRTVLHEFGHVADAQWLTDELRNEFTALRGVPSDTPWTSSRSHRLEDWDGSPSEDFAEVVAAVWSADRWEIRTDVGPVDDPVREWVDQLIARNVP